MADSETTPQDEELHDDILDAGEIDALLGAAPQADAPPSAVETSPVAAPAESGDAVTTAEPETATLEQGEIESLLSSEPAPGSAAESPSPTTINPAEVASAFENTKGSKDDHSALGEPQPYAMPALDAGNAVPGREQLDTIKDVELDLTIELGRTEMAIENVVQLREGSVVALDKLAGDPVDILVNGRAVARGEVLVLNDNFCVRVTEIITPE